jgi:hypothetical protein
MPSKSRNDLLKSMKRSKVNQDLADEASKDYYDRKSTNVEFPVGARVWLNDPAHKVGLNEKMRPKVTGPWIVKKKCNVNYEIETEQGEPTKTQTVHRNRLRTCHSPPIRVDAPPSPTTVTAPEPPVNPPDDAGKDNSDDEEGFMWIWQQPPTVAVPPPLQLGNSQSQQKKSL